MRRNDIALSNGTSSEEPRPEGAELFTPEAEFSGSSGFRVGYHFLSYPGLRKLTNDSELVRPHLNLLGQNSLLSSIYK